MNEASQSITQSFRELRRFCGDVALLLQTAETLFAKDKDFALDGSGWQSAMKNSACWGVEASRSYKEPDHWIPTEFFRFFTHDERKNLLVYVSFQADLHDESRLHNALVTGGAIVYPPNATAPRMDGRRFFFSQLHFKRPDRVDDGTVLCGAKPFENWRNGLPGHAETIITLARQADDVRDTKQLKSLIIAPLLQAIEDTGNWLK